MITRRSAMAIFGTILIGLAFFVPQLPMELMVAIVLIALLWERAT